MVRYGKSGIARYNGPSYQLTGEEFSIAEEGMGMKINHHHKKIPQILLKCKVAW
jgi:hypothetical protein